jgi:hypothetical protein
LEGLLCSCLVRSSKSICGHINNSRLLVRVHRRYNRRGVRESIMGLAVAVGRDSVMSRLGRSVERVVIHRVRAGRESTFITGPPDVANQRSAPECRRRDHRIRVNPGALGVPLGAVIWSRPFRIRRQSRGQLAGQQISDRFCGWMRALSVRHVGTGGRIGSVHPGRVLVSVRLLR